MGTKRVLNVVLVVWQLVLCLLLNEVRRRKLTTGELGPTEASDRDPPSPAEGPSNAYGEISWLWPVL